MEDILVVYVDVWVVQEHLQDLDLVVGGLFVLVPINLREAIEQRSAMVFIQTVDLGSVVEEQFAQLCRVVQVDTVGHKVVEGSLLVKILCVGISPLLEQSLEVGEVEVVLHLNYLDQGDLVAVVAVIDRRGEVAKKEHELYLAVQRGIEERDRSVGVDDVGCAPILQQELKRLFTQVVVVLDWDIDLKEAPMSDFLAEKMEGSHPVVVGCVEVSDSYLVPEEF